MAPLVILAVALIGIGIGALADMYEATKRVEARRADGAGVAYQHRVRQLARIIREGQRRESAQPPAEHGRATAQLQQLQERFSRLEPMRRPPMNGRRSRVRKLVDSIAAIGQTAWADRERRPDDGRGDVKVAALRDFRPTELGVDRRAGREIGRRGDRRGRGIHRKARRTILIASAIGIVLERRSPC